MGYGIMYRNQTVSVLFTNTPSSRIEIQSIDYKILTAWQDACSLPQELKINKQ